MSRTTTSFFQYQFPPALKGLGWMEKAELRQSFLYLKETDGLGYLRGL